MYSKLFRRVSLSSFSSVSEVHAAHKPSIFMGALSGESWRHDSMGKTLKHVTDPNKYVELQNHAEKNLKNWAQKKLDPPLMVEVVYKDWGLAAQEATRTYGTAYAVLNMANSLFPGGAALEGGSAQEENLWHRSTCVRSLLDDIVYLDKESYLFQYNDVGRALLEGKAKMTEDELDKLRTVRGDSVTEAYKVFFSPEFRICFRGPEVLVPPNMDDTGAGHQLVADCMMSYVTLPPTHIFPFYELRSAAPELISKSNNWDNQEVLKQYEMDLRRRIGAQLDTLIVAGQHHVILGAWGCGAFKNDPVRVAKIYCEEIEKRAHFFQHILFPIINTDSHIDNYGVFKKYLTGLKLNNTDSADPGFKY
ncbi:poly(ADP-ribose) glycohydrolase domain-containing protein [Legionella maioricensis]|uniref:DUF2263 domain-containing protein n=1 Tax=Legionella maioricensis TaxID=2896528 RepID=A0A9X2D1E6_9GAMM|nr:poly(ADP-ribose) glycohydrolase domain-containing protein [Legionella maioricensis]MCL9684542.1 DUF2263 domain-containing protein [Legionella maioricensis]MCL9687864.1 DUF2263 domain-containing protein [Legionella maioricensis]